MRKPAVISPSDEINQLGRVFDTPVVVKGTTWLPVSEFIIWIFTTWLAGKRRPERALCQRIGVGLLTMPVISGLEWCHNFAHAAAAYLIRKPMDAMRVTWGTPLVVYYDINDPTVTPRQHILRALGGPMFNAFLLPSVLYLRGRTHPDSVARDIADVAVGMNTFLCTVSMLPLPGIDGGAVLKWSLVEGGSTLEEADETVRKVNAVLGVVLGITSALAFKKKRHLLGALIAPFAALSLTIGSGLLREQ